MITIKKQDSIYNLDIPTRIYNRLKKNRLNTINDLIKKDAQYFLNLKGFGAESLYLLNEDLKIKFGEIIKNSEEYTKKAERRHAQINIFNQNFENIFNKYRNRKTSSSLDELETFLNKPDTSSKLFFAKIQFSSFESADSARRFNNSNKVRLFRKSLENFACQDLGLQGVICNADEYWNKFRTELKEILDLVLDPIRKKGSFGKLNAYAVFLLMSTYDKVFDGNTLKSRLLFVKNLNQFFRYENKVLNRPENSPLNVNSSLPMTIQRQIKKIRLEKNSILETINEIVNFKINTLIFSNSKNSSFFQFAIMDKINFLLDFPDCQSNENYKKAEFVRQLLLNYSFKFVSCPCSLKEKEFTQELSDDNVLIQANCGSDQYFISGLIEVFSRKILGLTNKDFLEVEYID